MKTLCIILLVLCFDLAFANVALDIYRKIKKKKAKSEKNKGTVK